MNDYLKYRLQIKNEGKPPRQNKPQKIAAFSKKRQAANKVYAEKSRPFWKGKACQIRSPVCTGAAQGIHHRKGKASVADLLDERYWMAACNFCNAYVETNDAWARTMGFKVSRLK